MRSYLRSKLAELRGCSSGNATLVVALGMPMLLGGAGLGVDVAQWYMWKRELQFAVDQAAVAGAWAQSDINTQALYKTRARQEFDANTNVVEDFATLTDANIALADYDGGTDNSVTVQASVTKGLPFSTLVTGQSATIGAFAQAVIEGGVNFQACMLALNKTKSQAFKFGGSVSGSSACGAGSLSTANPAMKELGNNNVPLGTVVAAGGVDSTFSDNGTIYQNQDGLANPYEDLEPPSDSGQVSRAYPETCPVAQPASITYTADGTTKTHYVFKYFRGSNSNNWTEENYTSGTGYIANSWSDPVEFVNKSVSSDVTGERPETDAAEGTPYFISGSGSNRLWRVPYTSTQDTVTDVYTHQTPAQDGTVYLEPGIYGEILIACKTVFAPGVYFVSGDLDFGQNLEVTGTGGVMFVLTGAGTIHVNSNSNVALSGIASSTLINDYGYDAESAAQLAGMLIWDPESTDAFTMNGNSTLNLSGIFYMPNRDVTFNGSSTAAGNCLMVAADTIEINGNFSLNNFCVTTGGSAMSIGGGDIRVRLVA